MVQSHWKWAVIYICIWKFAGIVRYHHVGNYDEAAGNLLDLIYIFFFILIARVITIVENWK